MSELKNMAVCDLRNIRTLQAAKELTSIKNVVLLLFSKTAPEDVLSVLQTVEKKNVASVLTVDEDARVQNYNGNTEITGADCRPDTENIITVNGTCVLHPMPADCRCHIAVNGLLVEHESLQSHEGVRVLTLNGSRHFARFSRVQVMNGFAQITDAQCGEEDETLFVANGNCIVHALSRGKRCGLLANGLLIEHISLREQDRVQIVSTNGKRFYADFHEVRQLHDKMRIDAAFLQKLPPKTLLFADKSKKKRLTFARDVTPELLEEKQPVIRGEVVCPRKLLHILALCCIDCSPRAARL